LARIYFSSTYVDLKDYRETVYRQLTKLTGHHVTAGRQAVPQRAARHGRGLAAFALGTARRGQLTQAAKDY
jgi:hypothetical protein